MTETKAVTLWQIGRDDSPAEIEPKQGSWFREYNYTVEIDSDSINNPSIPQLVAIPHTQADNQEHLSTGKLNIYFTLDCNHEAEELTLFYGCFGRQKSCFLLDGQPLLNPVIKSSSEEFQQLEITLPKMTVGDHILTITVSGEQQDPDYQVISYLKLEAKQLENLEPEALELEILTETKADLLPVPEDWAAWIADKTKLNIWNQLW